MNTNRRTMTVQEAAIALGVSLKRIYDMIWEKRLPAVKNDGKWAVSSEVIEQRMRESRHGSK